MLAVSNVGKVVIITVCLLAILIGATAWVAFQPSTRCNDLCTVIISSVHLSGGFTASNATEATSNFTFTLLNPGTSTYIGSISLSDENLSSPVTYWSTTPSKNGSLVLDEQTTITTNTGNGTVQEIEQVQQAPRTGNGPTLVASGTSTTFIYYPVTNSGASQIRTGQTYSFVINFANGQSVSGVVTAQD